MCSWPSVSTLGSVVQQWRLECEKEQWMDRGEVHVAAQVGVQRACVWVKKFSMRYHEFYLNFIYFTC